MDSISRLRMCQLKSQLGRSGQTHTCSSQRYSGRRKLAHSFQRQTTRFGNIVTADHVSSAEEGGINGLNGKVIALILKDV
jgi:hypothetical protein